MSRLRTSTQPQPRGGRVVVVVFFCNNSNSYQNQINGLTERVIETNNRNKTFNSPIGTLQFVFHSHHHSTVIATSLMITSPASKAGVFTVDLGPSILLYSYISKPS